MSHDLASLMKMGVSDLAELAIKYDAPMSTNMGKKELAREVCRAYGAYEATQFNQLLEEENVWTDSSGEEKTLLSGQSFMQMNGADKLMPHEIATDLMSHESAASAFAFAYKHSGEKIHNDILVSLRQAGVDPGDVYGQLSNEYRNSSYVPLPRELKSVLNKFEGYSSGNSGGLDILGGMAGYYDGNDEKLMGEFTTPKQLGGLQVQQALEAVAASYVNRASYAADDLYNHDVASFSRRMQAGLGESIQSIASQIAIEKQAGKDAYTSYADILPQGLGDKRLSGIIGARLPEPDVMKQVRKNMRGVAAVYGYGSASTNQAGVTGLGIGRKPDERLNAINELTLQHADEPDYMAEGNRGAESALSLALREQDDTAPPEGSAAFIGPLPRSRQLLVPPAPAPQFAPEMEFGRPPALTSSTNGITFHSVNQNSAEWDNLRSEHVTASMAGALLGNNKYSDPLAAVFQSVGFNPFGIENIHNQHFKRGHRLEEIGRAKYAAEFGHRVDQVGFVTNDKYPGLGVSPDGLIGDDGLVEFKAPAANRFFDPLKKPEYLDQVQMQMAVTGRKWTDLTQVGENYGNDGKAYQWLGRVDRIHADPKWAEQNAGRLQDMGAMIQEGRTLMGAVESGSMSKDEFIDVMSKAVAKGNVEGVQILRDRAAGSAPNLGGRTEQLSPNHQYQGGTNRRIQGEVVPYSGGGSNGGNSPNWSEPINDKFHEEDADFDDVLRQNTAQETKDILREFNQSEEEQARAVKAEARAARNDNVKRLTRAIDGGGSFADKAINVLSFIQPEIGLPLKLGKTVLDGAIEAADMFNEEFGSAQDVGIENTSAYTTSKRNLETLGLNASQAKATTDTIGGAAALLAAGDPSAAAHIVTGTRGLISLEDIRSTTNPSDLADLAAQRAREQGLTQQEYAGRAMLAGLPIGRLYNESAEAVTATTENDRKIMSGDDAYLALQSNSRLRTARVESDLGYYALSHGEQLFSSDAVDGLTKAIDKGQELINGVAGGAETGIKDAYHFASGSVESGLNPNAVNTQGSSARGLYQVLKGTAHDPGFGIAPIQNESFDEYNRVGEQLLDHYIDHYKGNGDKAAMAVRRGQGFVDELVDKYGDKWQQHLTPDLQGYLHKWDQAYDQAIKNSSMGANSFGNTNYGSTNSNGMGNLKVDVTIHGDDATAKVSVNNKAIKSKRVKIGSLGQVNTVVS
jgi:hypothetical protein